MSIYDADWQDKPAGYYADPEVKARHDRWVLQEQRFTHFVDEELRIMGHDPETVLDSDVLTEAETRARRRL
ncbi:hypothetical protein [Halospeciosus flavus]|uniref:Uncharacterized protein n=1 Tax=Halospeciosus flavus TaxID=3032283 RepID=A0ABD5Z2Y1_9EURY|nr:hypothetical protein [Halospeciosus flavus]